jgi:hypothetical protein
MFISNSERRNTMTVGSKPGYVQPMLDVVLSAPFEGRDRRRVSVNPPTIHIGGPEPPKTIRWINKTGKPVHVWLPSVKDFLESKEDLLKPLPIAVGDELVVGVKGCQGVWERDYHVFCEEIGNFADGNSPPTVSCP